jgi:A/G-specific adenine glycosylase
LVFVGGHKSIVSLNSACIVRRHVTMPDMPDAATNSRSAAKIALLLTWYDRAGRTMPWRARAGQSPNPYHVWLSEIMLQQTTVATVGPYFHKFLTLWPSVDDLGAAALDDVLTAWAGLGYYARARNLHKCAGVLHRAGGRFPDTEEGLRALPGIGLYTAAAIAAIAFNRAVVPVDGNVERVTARLWAVSTPLPQAKPELRERAQAFADDKRPGDAAQALMDLGAMVCTPRKPSCGTCPLNGCCRALDLGIAAELPRRAPKKKRRPVRRAVAFWLQRADGAVLLRRRPDKGLLGGMLEIPSTPWREADWPAGEAAAHAPAELDWRPQAGAIGHTFTHFHLDVAVWRAGFEGDMDGMWIKPGDFDGHAIPTLMRKIARHALSSEG